MEDPIGVGILFPHGHIGGIFNVGILPAYQKQGYGRILMEYLMQRAYTLRLEHLVLISSTVAEKLYRQLGFQTALEVDIYAQP